MNSDKIAEAIYKASHPEWRGYIPLSIEVKYRRMAEAAVAAMELTQEIRPLPDAVGGVMTNYTTGEVTMHIKPPTIQTRWVTPWQQEGDQ